MRARAMVRASGVDEVAGSAAGLGLGPEVARTKDVPGGRIAEPTVGIGAAARAAGVSLNALRYYESQELMRAPVARDAGGRRRYTPDDLHWIGALTRLRATGMPIARMKLYAQATRDGDSVKCRRILGEHRQAVAAQIEVLAEHLTHIDAKLERLTS